MPDARETLLAFLKRDLLGPQNGDNEEIEARPSDQYMTGILFAQPPEDAAAELVGEEDNDRDFADEDGGPGEGISMRSMRRPTSMGISFSVEGEHPHLVVSGSAGRYLPSEEKQSKTWKRHPITLKGKLPVLEGLHPHPSEAGLRWWVRAYRQEGRWQITLILENTLRPEPGRENTEKSSFFQVGFSVTEIEGGRLIPRQMTRTATDDDSRTNDLIYRNVREWAVGHTCGATWSEDPPSVSSDWIPTQLVRSVDAAGHAVFQEISRERTGSASGAFNARQLATETSAEKLAEILRTVPDAYCRWLDEVEAAIRSQQQSGKLSEMHAERARKHIEERARKAVQRMLQSVELIRTDPTTRRAFQLSQEAMLIQRQWSEENPAAELQWRPFQLGFQLLTLASLSHPTNDEGEPTEDRRTMDLLWFPTGGGKTEAYLTLTAFVLFYRRLRCGEQPDLGAGVAVMMRYTLRLLTIQQFERASRLIVACEVIRRRQSGAGEHSLGNVPFSIGLWVGGEATPNSRADARLAQNKQKARQLAKCPACSQKKLLWDPLPQGSRYLVRCGAPGCPTSGWDLPVWTIDEDVYDEQPSLLIGTIDKFAQIVRKPDTHRLFGDDLPPPEFIIQDELHLISGPLGTVAGIYEAAIDLLCTHNGVPPKVIGSTATIRRAEEQVRSLFDRNVMQFPPPVLDAEDSCFAVIDHKVSGRLYVGLTTIGRSPKFVLQAACASLLQGASEPEIDDNERDPYWTLVTYFNSLRELGGALVMMLDDVNDSIKIYAEAHGSEPREIGEEPRELTSRVDSSEIPEVLDQLSQKYPDQDTAVVLATNMLSVGVDIPRLGLMIVNGQPKSMSEYIQATSRVGRGKLAGLVVTSYNAGRPRDRSHFEAFRTWHQTLYREVEATSVTPFAPRARDRALHAAVVAIARHLVVGMLNAPTLDNRSALEALLKHIDTRIQNADPGELAASKEDIQRLLDMWQQRGFIDNYWNDFKPSQSLLISAENAAAEKAVTGRSRNSPIPTPNSMRDVEPSVALKMKEALWEDSR